MKKINYSAEKWTLYLVRPFDIFGASIWHSWYNSAETKKVFGRMMPSVLFIEDKEHIARCYKTKADLDLFNKSVEKIIDKDPDKLLQMFKSALRLVVETKKYLQVGPDSFKSLEKSLNFLTKSTIFSTILPFRAGAILNQRNASDPKIIKLKEINYEIRQQSYYSQFIQEIILPLAKNYAKKKGFKNINSIGLLTIDELFNKNEELDQLINQRIEEVKKGNKYIYQVLKNKESIIWVRNNDEIISRIENIPKKAASLKGKTAFPGVVSGKVKLICTLNDLKKKFDKGDIMVTINSNPSLMPIIRKASAIVADEGGIMCHAAIISRELKIPCIIGTKIATKIFKDGDYVEVDAGRGIVRKINNYAK